MTDRCAPIRDLLDGLTGEPKPRPTRCGGAILRVTVHTWQAIARRYAVDFVEPMVLPADGSAGDVRVVCDAPVLDVAGIGGPIHLATCARCAGIEANQRRMLADVAAHAAGDVRR